MVLEAKPGAPHLAVVAVDGGNPRVSRPRDYARIAKALDYLATHHIEQPRLATIAAEVGLSEYHIISEYHIN